jgi:hypothetical protein
MRTWRAIHASYERLRERYYLLADGEWRVPPKSTEFRWAWTRDLTVWGQTHFDEEGDPHLLELSPRVRGYGGLTRGTLLHELSHMRLGPTVNCNHRDKKWRAEVVRLAVAGAFSREAIF